MTKKTIVGYVLFILGIVLVIGTAGRSDWQDLAPGVRPEEILPFWRIFLQAGIGVVILFLGARLAGLFK